MTAPPLAGQGMHLRALWVEAWRSMRARPVAAVLVLVLTGGVCWVSLTTVGRSVAAEQQVAAQLEDSGARVLVVANGGGWDVLGPDVVKLAASLVGVERAIGVGAPRDVTNAGIANGERGPAWGLSGDLADALTLVAGRMPREGEALVSVNSQHWFGFAEPAGAVVDPVTGRSFAVVGAYEPRTPFGDLDGVVVRAPAQDARELRVVLADIGAASEVQRVVLSLIGDAATTQVAVTSPVTVAELHTSIVGTLGRFGSSLLVLILGMGAVLIAAVVAADTAMASVEWGRRRALGASRSQLVVLATIRVGLASLAGAVFGIGLAVGAAAWQGWSIVASFAGAVGVLAVMVGVVSALPPAARAARRDPVSVLRTP